MGEEVILLFGIALKKFDEFFPLATVKMYRVSLDTMSVSLLFAFLLFLLFLASLCFGFPQAGHLYILNRAF